MGRTVGELKATITTDELAYWYAVNRISPIDLGFPEMDALFANLCMRLYDVNGAKKQFGGRFVLDDFRLFKPAETRTPIQMMRSMFGHRVKRK